MARLEYTITGNNSALINAINQSIAGVNNLQGAIDKLNKINFNGISGAFASATQSINNFTNAAKKGTQAFTDQQISEALNRMNGRLATATGNFELFGGSIKNSQQTINAYQQAINSLLANGITPTDSRIVGFKGHIDELTKSIKFQNEAAKTGTSGGSFGASLGNGISGAITSLQGLATGYLGLFAVVGGISKVISSNAEISDSLADIRRTAGLTQPEVESLFNSLKKIDTRTSLKGLADIAIIGGQLGIAKDQLVGFTKATDQLSVSLSGELKGGPEEVAQSLGILDKVFGISAKNGGDVEKSFNKIGSVILGLGQSGLATGDFLADFGKRVGAVAAQAKLSLPVLLSYGATLQEQGVTAEVAGTAFKKLLGSLAAKRDAFLPIAQIADSTLTIKSFTDLINNDTQKALSLFFEGLAKGGSTTTAFADLLKSVGLDAARSGQAITALALHQGELNDHIKESVNQYKQGTLAADQFLIKNDTLGGSVDKLGKAFVSLTTTGNVSSFFKSIVDGLTNTLNGFSTLVNSASWGEFFNRLSHPFGQDSKNAIDLQYSIPKAIKESKSVASDFNKTNNPLGSSNDAITALLADKSAVQLKAMIDKYKAATVQAVGALNDYRKGIAKGLISDSGEFSVEDATKNFHNLQNILDIVTHAYVQVRDKSAVAKTSMVKDSGEIADAELKTVKAINARILSLKNDTLANPENAKTDIQRIDALRDRLAQFKDGTNKATGGSFLSLSQSLDDILLKTKSLSDQSGLRGYLLDVQKITDKYKELNQEVEQNLSKGKLDLKNGTITRPQFNTLQAKASTDTAALTEAKNKELADARITEAKRVVDEIQRINDEFGIKSEQTRAKELAQIQARYDAEVVKANGNSQILQALDADRLVAIQAINDKYLAIQQNLYDQIALIDNQSNATITGLEESQTAKIKNEWEKRRIAANKYYEQLKTLALSAPDLAGATTGINNIVKGFNIGVLNNKQATTNSSITNASNTDVANQLTKPFFDVLKNGLSSASNNFLNTLENLNQQANHTFGSIFSSLTNSLTKSINQIFVTVIEKGLGNALQKAIASGTNSLINSSGKLTTTGALAAGAGIAGGIISGSTSSTSTVGQGLGGALSGAATGAVIGSVVPGLGTAAGAIVGGAIGLIGGIFSSSKAQKELQAQQLAEQKQQTDLLKASLAYTSSIIGRLTTNGVVTGINVGATGQLVATVAGKDLQFVLSRTQNGR